MGFQKISRAFKSFQLTLKDFKVFDWISSDLKGFHSGPHQIHQGFHGISLVRNQCLKGFRLFIQGDGFNRFKGFQFQAMSWEFQGISIGGMLR